MDDIEDLKLDVSQLRQDICEQKNALREQNDCYLAEKRCGRIVSSLSCLLITLWLIACTFITLVLFTIAVGCMGALYSGFITNPQDIAPNFAGAYLS